MTNPFFNNTTTLVAFTRARAENVESKFTLVATGFDTVNTTFALKGTIAGQVWTGTHDFTAATVTGATQSVGDSSTKFATTAFVAATAFSSILPGQTGNSGKYLTTDGTNASWGSNLAANVGGTGITSYAIGDLLYASGATALSKLAAVATGNVLISGGVTTAPSWGKVGLTTHISGVLGAANGGTGIANDATQTTTRSGNYAMTITLTGTSSVTFPTAGTLATLTGPETLTNKVLTSPNINAITNLTTNGLVYTTGGTGTLATNTQFSPAVLAQASSLTLPDLSLVTAIPHVIAPTNATVVPTNLTTSDGWSVVSSFSAGTLAVITSSHSSTAHGSWGTRTMTPPQIGSTVVSASAAITVYASVQLDTNLYVLLFGDTTNFYTVAIDTNAGTIGTAVSFAALNATTQPTLFKVTTTSFVAVVQHAAAATTFRAGSVAGTVITHGTAQTTGSAPACRAIQLSSSLYATAQLTANDLIAFSVSGTTVTLGTAVASGAVATNVTGYIQIQPQGATTFLVTYLSTGGGSTTTRALSGRIGSVSGTTITLNTATAGASNIENNAGFRLLRSFNGATGPWLAVCQNGATITSGDFYGLSVSGTTVTISAVTTRANDLPSYSPGVFTYIFNQVGAYSATELSIVYNATTILLGHLAAGPYAITISGTTLAFGAATTLSAASTKNFTLDLATSTSFYATGGGVYDKLSVSGTTITSTDNYAVAAPAVITSDTLNDKAAKYGGTWYSWTFPTFLGPVTSTKWLFRSGTNDMMLNGPLS